MNATKPSHALIQNVSTLALHLMHAVETQFAQQIIMLVCAHVNQVQLETQCLDVFNCNIVVLTTNVQQALYVKVEFVARSAQTRETV